MTKRWMTTSLVHETTKWAAKEGKVTLPQRQTQLEVIQARLSVHFLSKDPGYIPVAPENCSRQSWPGEGSTEIARIQRHFYLKKYLQLWIQTTLHSIN